MITFYNVSKNYVDYNGKSIIALNNININIKSGEFVFLTGQSGSGKSTFLKLIIREELPTLGSIYVAGYSVKNILDKQISQFRQKIGFIFQDFRLLKNKNVFDNVAFSMHVLGKSNTFIKYHTDKVLKTVGLEKKAISMPYQLSGGEQQKVSMARAIANNPIILLADEPTGNLDHQTSKEVMQIINKINQNGTTVVMATHNKLIVNCMNKRTIHLQSGLIIKDGKHCNL